MREGGLSPEGGEEEKRGELTFETRSIADGKFEVAILGESYDSREDRRIVSALVTHEQSIDGFLLKSGENSFGAGGSFKSPDGRRCKEITIHKSSAVGEDGSVNADIAASEVERAISVYEKSKGEKTA